MKEVAMKVNQANLVKSLKFSFTNKTTVLGELMQNARRANATQVVFEFAPETKILRVTDDGCGIDSIETLLTVAESGWDADVVAQEHPFGIGFLSALFACRHMTVVSKSGRISVNTDDVLSFKPVIVSPVTDWDGITAITMLGVDLEIEQIESMLNQLAQGFPIPVEFNGTSLDRKCALDSGLHFVDTEIGAVYLDGVDNSNSTVRDFEVYLQGLPVYKSYSNHRVSMKHVIHLDSSRFYARLPDRDKLIDEKEVIALVRTVLAQEMEKHFTLFKTTAPADVFVLFYDTLKHWKLLSLLNDVPVVPREVLHEYDDYPVCDTEVYSDFTRHPDKALTRSEVESREVVNFNDDMQNEGSALHMFAWKRESLIYNDGLDNAHWIYPMIRYLDDEELTTELVNASHGALFEGEWTTVYVHFCDAYRIQIGNDVVEIADSAFYHGEDQSGLAVVPKGDASGYILKQISSYKSEYDEFQESTHESDVYAFSSFTVANTASDPADAMKKLIPSSFNCPSLNSKSFVITLDDGGKVASVTAA